MKNGGKCLDVEVILPSHVSNTASLDTISVLNNTTSDIAKVVHCELESLFQQCYYISKHIIRTVNELDDLDKEEERLLQSIILDKHMQMDSHNDKSFQPRAPYTHCDDDLVQRMYMSTEATK